MVRYISLNLLIGMVWGQADIPEYSQAELDYQKADQMMSKYAGQKGYTEYWAEKKREAAKRMMEEKERMMEEKERMMEEKRKKYTLNDYLIIPLINDSYAVEKRIISDIIGTPKDNFEALDYIDSKKLHLNELTDFHLRKLGKMYNVDWVVHGNIYKINKALDYNKKTIKEYKPSAEFLVGKERTKSKEIYKNKVDYDGSNDLLEGLVSVLDYNENESEKNRQAQEVIDAENRRKHRIEEENDSIEEENLRAYNRAKAKAGTWIYGTIFKINSNTGKKVYLYENEVLFKID